MSQRRKSSAKGSNFSSSFAYKYQFVVIGESRVGKSALVRRWLDPETFVETHTKTVDESYRCSVQLNGVRLPIRVVDTGGSYCFPAMRRLLACDAHGFLFVFDPSDRHSFNRLKELRQEIDQFRCASPTQPTEAYPNRDSTSVPGVLVANKTDGGNTTDSFNLRLEARELAEQLGYDYIETSAKENHNVDLAFRCLVSRVEKANSVGIKAGTRLYNERNKKPRAKKMWSMLSKMLR